MRNVNGGNDNRNSREENSPELKSSMFNGSNMSKETIKKNKAKRKTLKSPTNSSAEKISKFSPDKARNFKFNLKAIRTKITRPKSKYELLLDDLNKLK